MHTRHILILVGADYEDLELWYPKLRLIEAGIGVTVAGPEREATYAGKHGYPCPCDAAISEMEADDFQGVLDGRTDQPVALGEVAMQCRTANLCRLGNLGQSRAPIARPGAHCSSDDGSFGPVLRAHTPMVAPASTCESISSFTEVCSSTLDALESEP